MRLIRTHVIPIAIAAACLPSLPAAAEVQATSSTQYLHYPDYLSGNKGLDDVAQYFRLSATRLDDEGKLNVYGYGRVIGQLTTGFEKRPELAGDVIGRLYYLYLDYRDVIKDHLDLRAGRTYVPAAALAGTVDGLHVDVRNLGPLGLTAFGGRRVIPDNKSEIGGGKDSLWGGSAYLDTVLFTHVEGSYARKYADGDLAQETLAFDLSTTPVAMVNLVGRVKYDLASERYSEVLAGASFAPLANLVLRGEFYSSFPTFDSFSFYSFFHVNHYRQLSASAEYQLFGSYRLSARYASERFDENATADLFEAGLSARPLPGLALAVSYQARSGYAGRLGGVRASGSYRILGATVLAGIDYDDFRRDGARDGTAKKYWAGLNYEFNKTFSATARLEDDVNFYANDLCQGFVAAHINL